MPEINNSLALGIKADPIDIMKPLAGAAQINSLRASTAKTQQDVDYNQFLQDQGGGYRPSEANTLAETNQKRLGLAGQIGNILVNDQSTAARMQALKAAKASGVNIDPQVEQHIMTAPASTVKQYGQNMRNAAMPSSTNMEATGEVTRNQGQYIPQGIAPNEPIISRTEAATGGRKQPTQDQVDSAIKNGRNLDGSKRVLSTANIAPNPDGSLPSVKPTVSPGIVHNPDGSISSNVTHETEATQKSLGEDYAGYKDSAKKAAMTKYLLHNMTDDADRLSTGKGATFTGTVKQWIQSAQTLPGVGNTVKSITGDISDPIAAFEALQKNAGQLTRATLQDVDGKAASEYRMIQQQLPNVEMSPRGLKLVTAQMMAPEDFKQAKLQAADKWKSGNNGSLSGFEADWNKNVSPTTFLFARLPPSDRDALIKNLNKTDTGRSQLQSIRRQTKWAHENGLDEFVD